MKKDMAIGAAGLAVQTSVWVAKGYQPLPRPLWLGEMDLGVRGGHEISLQKP